MANKSFVVQYLIKAREQFSAAADKVGRSSESMRKSVERAKKSFASFTETARRSGAVLTAAVTLPIGLLAVSLKNAARDAIETRSKFATVFKDIAAESERSANTLASNFGLSGTKARELLGDTGDLLSGFGFTGAAALTLSTQVNELAVDLASFTNFSGGAEGASAALTKALLGERESLKSLGIAISEKDVKAKISQLLAEGQTFGSLRQAKAQATLALAVQQSKNAIGDFARTSGDLANQERITASRIQDLKESFGKILLPVALKVTQAIRSMVERLSALSPEAKRTIIIVAGIAAVLGPVLLLIGSIGLALPAMAAGFAAFGTVAALALGPLGLLAAGLALAAVLVINNWSKVRAFFSGFASGITTTFGPTMTRLVSQFQEAARVIAELFSSDSEAATNLSNFANIGTLVGDIIGGALDIIVRGISGMGVALGQLIGAVATFDFSAFDVAAIKAEFIGGTPAAPADITGGSTVDVGVNVGLDEGLKQTSAPAVSTSNTRRTDVGLGTAAI